MEDNVLIISLNGHIDSGNAADVEKEINQLREENTFENVYLDAENLEYISSAGLRIILRLRKTYSELKTLKKHIKKTYDIKYFYSAVQTNPWYYNEDFSKICSGDEILAELDKYDKNFFKTKALYYNCIDYTSIINGVDITYSFDCVKVQKKINSKGKLTCTMYVKRTIEKFEKHKENKNDANYIDDSSAYFIELNKKDIKGVQNYQLQHYEAFDLEYIPQYATAAGEN